MDNAVTVAVRDELSRFEAPTWIVWGTGDEFFDVAWARWLSSTIAGTVDSVEREGAKLFFPAERWSEFNAALRRLLDRERQCDCSDTVTASGPAAS
jgi:pimeloyl-ACP methyl ester carboxylesterase